MKIPRVKEILYYRQDRWMKSMIILWWCQYWDKIWEVSRFCQTKKLQILILSQEQIQDKQDIVIFNFNFVNKTKARLLIIAIWCNTNITKWWINQILLSSNNKLRHIISTTATHLWCSKITSEDWVCRTISICPHHISKVNNLTILELKTNEMCYLKTMKK